MWYSVAFGKPPGQPCTSPGPCKYALSRVHDWFPEEVRLPVVNCSETSRAADAEPRLSPFEPRARALIASIYADLAAHANFDGVLFHDDGRLSELEDASPAAMRAYREAFGETFAFEALRSDAALARRWATLRTDALLDLSTEITAAVREYRPTAKTVRNLFAPVVLDASLAQEHFAQDYAAFLRRYDYVAVMAMPYLEQARDPRRFYERLAVAALRVPLGGLIDRPVIHVPREARILAPGLREKVAHCASAHPAWCASPHAFRARIGTNDLAGRADGPPDIDRPAGGILLHAQLPGRWITLQPPREVCQRGARGPAVLRLLRKVEWRFLHSHPS